MSADVAWAAGFFDGEGTSYVDYHTNLSKKKYPYVCVTAPQVADNREVLDKLQRIFGGSVHKRGVRRGRPQMTWRIRNRPGAEEVMRRMWPHLGTAKRTQFCLAYEKAYDETFQP